MPNSNSKKFNRLASLYVLNAMSKTEKENFENQLKTDQKLRKLVREYKATLDSTKEAVRFKINTEYLQGQRNLLRGRIEQIENVRSRRMLYTDLQEKASSVFSRLVLGRQPAWAVVTYVFIAFLIGRLVFMPQPGSQDNRTDQQFDIQNLVQSGGLENVDIDIIEGAEEPIKFVTHGNQNIDFSGGLKDTKVRQMLYFLLLNDENPGNRLKAVNLLRNVSPDPESQMVLVSSMLSDPNSGVRLQSVKLLGRYRPNERLLNACQKVLLEDENEAVRMEALHILAKEPTESLIPLLQVVSNMDDNEYIRDESRRLLTNLRSPISIENIEATQ
jgi:hypothetical protein